MKAADLQPLGVDVMKAALARLDDQPAVEDEVDAVERATTDRWTHSDVDPDSGTGAGEDRATENPPTTPARRLLHVVTLADTLAAPPPEPPVLVEGLLRKGELAGLGGARAWHKSWLLMQLAATLAEGEQFFLGRFAVPTAARVLYMHGELSPWAAHRRWVALRGGQPESCFDSFDRWRIKVMRTSSTDTERHDSGSSSTRDEEMVARLDPRVADTVAELEADVVIIDPWARFYLGNENDNAQVEAAVCELEGLARRTGAAVVLAHHFSKASDVRDPEDLWRGASRLPDALDTRMTLDSFYTTAEIEEQGMTPAQARRFAQMYFLVRTGPPLDRLPMVFDLDAGGWSYWANAPQRGPARRISPEQAASWCREDGGQWGSVRAAVEAFAKRGHSGRRDTIQGVLDDGVRMGLFERYDGPNRAVGYRLTGANRPAGNGTHRAGVRTEELPAQEPIPGASQGQVVTDPPSHSLTRENTGANVVPPFGGEADTYASAPPGLSDEVSADVAEADVFEFMREGDEERRRAELERAANGLAMFRDRSQG